MDGTKVAVIGAGMLGSFFGAQPVNVAEALSHEKRLFFAISYAALDEVEQAFTAADDKRTGSLRVAVVP